MTFLKILAKATFVLFMFTSSTLLGFSEFLVTIDDVPVDTLIQSIPYAFNIICEPSESIYVEIIIDANNYVEFVNPLSIDETTKPRTVDIFTYPNPFNRKLKISYTVDKSTNVSIEIFDVNGKAVRTLLKNEKSQIGVHQILWDGCFDNGLEAGTGVYFVKLTSPFGSRIIKTLLIQ